jgi:DnaK suppressor protein
MAINTTLYKEKLEAEKKRLESELPSIAQRKEGTQSWEAVGTITDESIDADPNEVADKLEEFETNQAIVDSLKIELRDVNDALEKIEKGNYGLCEEGGEEIEQDRLDANPAARTCKAHMN